MEGMSSAGAGQAVTEAGPERVNQPPAPPSAVPAEQALAEIRREMAGIFDRASQTVTSGELGLIGWGLRQPRVQNLAAEHNDKHWFFIGDIHGDFLAWHRLFERVRHEPDFRLCFLGDLVDRGPMDIECFAAFLQAAEKHPGQLLWILGNHDGGLQFNIEGKFQSRVDPAEFADWLNEPTGGRSAKEVQPWGRLFIDICKHLPRAVLFPGGLLAVHGGVPLEDRWDSLNTLEAFQHERCLEDFTSTRATPYPRRLGWKMDKTRRQRSSDFEFGYQDLKGFCQAAQGVLSVQRIVRGHDHVEKGCEQPDCYKDVPLLTLNGFGFNYLNNSVRKYRPSLVLGVWRKGELPRVEEVTCPSEEHAAVYPQAQTAMANQGSE